MSFMNKRGGAYALAVAMVGLVLLSFADGPGNQWYLSVPGGFLIGVAATWGRK